MESRVARRRIEHRGSEVYVFEGGAGPALLLIHGGLGGAHLHWASVWERLTEHYRVIAPELPGFGRTAQMGFQSLEEYVEWLIAVLDLLEVAETIVVGNSLGGSLAWSLAGSAPERCRALVIVDGFPLPAPSRVFRWLGRTRAGSAILRSMVLWYAFRPHAVESAFAHIGKAPHELFETLALHRPALAANVAMLLVEGDDAPKPQITPHFLWGQEDHLLHSPRWVQRRIRKSMPGATFDLIAEAGHLPQLEEPELFVRALESRIDPSVTAEIEHWST